MGSQKNHPVAFGSIQLFPWGHADSVFWFCFCFQEQSEIWYTIQLLTSNLRVTVHFGGCQFVTSSLDWGSWSLLPLLKSGLLESCCYVLPILLFPKEPGNIAGTWLLETCQPSGSKSSTSHSSFFSDFDSSFTGSSKKKKTILPFGRWLLWELKAWSCRTRFMITQKWQTRTLFLRFYLLTKG